MRRGHRCPRTRRRGRFTGTVNWVQLGLGSDTHDHLIDPEHVMTVAMSLQ
jgi:arylsulfatase